MFKWDWKLPDVIIQNIKTKLKWCFQINWITGPWYVIHTPDSDSDPAGGSGNASAQSASWGSSWTWCGSYSRASLLVRTPRSFLFRISAIVPAAAYLLLLLWRKFICLIIVTLKEIHMFNYSYFEGNSYVITVTLREIHMFNYFVSFGLKVSQKNCKIHCNYIYDFAIL